MKQGPENLSAQQSLDIIAGMILQAKRNVRRNNFFFLLWGWVVALAFAGMYTLTQMDYHRPYIVWVITVPVWIFTLYKVLRQEKTERSVSHFDRISGWLWMTYGISTFILVFFGFKINYQLNAVILVISAIPTIVSGLILNFRPLIIGGVIFWISGIICFLVTRETQPLVGAIAIFCGYIIPGYWLRRKKD